MTTQFTVFKGTASGEITKGYSTRPDGLAPDEVLIKITHSGVCGTDLHYVKKDMVLGHEGVGLVKAVGPDVTEFRVGDRVGWGYNHNSCGQCDSCLSGDDIYCSDRQLYGRTDLHQGSFAAEAAWKKSFIYHIPDAIALMHAAPLMCGGATVFNVLYNYEIKTGDRVGIMGVGGLGHLGIQFASKMGLQVVVFSGTVSKREEAMALGAHEFHAVKGMSHEQLQRSCAKINALLVTASVQPDWSLYLPLMAPNGTIFPVTASSGNFSIPYSPLTMHGLRIQGSLVASRGTQIKMLRFAALHDIKPVVQTFPMSVEGINEAFKLLEHGKMRYRGVLIAQD